MHPNDQIPSQPEGASARSDTGVPRIELNADDVIDRMKKVIKVDTDTELSRALGTSNKNISSWRNRNSIPYEDVLRIALNFGESMEYVLTGKHVQSQIETLKSSPFDGDILRIITKDWVDDHDEGTFGDDKDRESELLAARIIVEYDRYVNLMRQATEAGRMNRREFLDALRKASSTDAAIETTLRVRKARRRAE